MCHRRQAPDDDHDDEAETRAEAIHQPAGDQQADRVGELEGEDDVGVVDFGPAELRLQRRLEDADHLPIDVVDRGGEEQQSADVPAERPIAAPAGTAAADAGLARFAAVDDEGPATGTEGVGIKTLQAADQMVGLRR